MSRSSTIRRTGIAVFATSLFGAFFVVTAPAASAYTGWTTLQDRPGVAVILLCKEPSDSYYYGPLWKVKIAALSGKGSTASATVNVRRYGTFINTKTASARDGQWVVAETYASRAFPDTVDGVVGFGNLQGNGAGGSFEPRSVANLANCV